MPRDSYTRYPRPILWLVPGGELTLPDGDGGSATTHPIEPFYISKLPVTNEQLEASGLDFERSPLSPGDRDPAAGVSFETAAAYAEWYAGVARKPMRLPSEPEWEYACRGSAPVADARGLEAALTSQIWHAGNSGPTLPRLDAKKANEFGLYGLLGGLWEWVVAEPREVGADGAGEPVLRGGSIRTAPEELSCSLRRPGREVRDLEDVGFRIVKGFR